MNWLAFSASATLLLALAAFWAIWTNRQTRREDREKESKARSAEELSKWAEEALRLYYLPYNDYKEQIAQGLIGLVTKNMLMSIAAIIIGDEFIKPTKRAEEALTDYCRMTRDRYYQKQRIEPPTLKALENEFEETFYLLLTYLYLLRYWDYDYHRFLEDAMEHGALKPEYQLSKEGGANLREKNQQS